MGTPSKLTEIKVKYGSSSFNVKEIPSNTFFNAEVLSFKGLFLKLQNNKIVQISDENVKMTYTNEWNLDHDLAPNVIVLKVFKEVDIHCME